MDRTRLVMIIAGLMVVLAIALVAVTITRGGDAPAGADDTPEATTTSPTSTTPARPAKKEPPLTAIDRKLVVRSVPTGFRQATERFDRIEQVLIASPESKITASVLRVPNDVPLAQRRKALLAGARPAGLVVASAPVRIDGMRGYRISAYRSGGRTREIIMLRASARSTLIVETVAPWAERARAKDFAERTLAQVQR